MDETIKTVEKTQEAAVTTTGNVPATPDEGTTPEHHIRASEECRFGEMCVAPGKTLYTCKTCEKRFHHLCANKIWKSDEMNECGCHEHEEDEDEDYQQSESEESEEFEDPKDQDVIDVDSPVPSSTAPKDAETLKPVEETATSSPTQEKSSLRRLTTKGIVGKLSLTTDTSQGPGDFQSNIMVFGPGVVTASLGDGPFAQVEWLSEFPNTQRLRGGEEVAFQTGALRPNDCDAQVWICGRVVKVLSKEVALVALMGDAISLYDETDPFEIQIKFLVPSYNFLIRRSARYIYFGNPRSYESLTYFCAERFVDSKGELRCMQSLDVFRTREVDFLVLFFAKQPTDMVVVMFRDPHTKDDQENDDDLFERLGMTTAAFLAAKFPNDASKSTDLGAAYCSFEHLDQKTQLQLRVVYNYVAPRAHSWLKSKKKLKTFNEISKGRTITKVNGSQPISAHARYFGSRPATTDFPPASSPSSSQAQARPLPLPPGPASSSEGHKTRSKSASTPKPIKPTSSQTTPKPKRKQQQQPEGKSLVKKVKAPRPHVQVLESSSESDFEMGFPLRMESFEQQQLTPKKSVPMTKTSPIGPLVTDERERLEQELRRYRERELDGLKDALQSSQAEIKSLNAQVATLGKERDMTKAALDSLRTTFEDQGRKWELTHQEMTNQLTSSKSKLASVEEDHAKLLAAYRQAQTQIKETSRLLEDFRAQRPDFSALKDSLTEVLDSKMHLLASSISSKVNGVSEEVSRLGKDVSTLMSQSSVVESSLRVLSQQLSMSMMAPQYTSTSPPLPYLHTFHQASQQQQPSLLIQQPLQHQMQPQPPVLIQTPPKSLPTPVQPPVQVEQQTPSPVSTTQSRPPQSSPSLIQEPSSSMSTGPEAMAQMSQEQMWNLFQTFMKAKK